jgi:DNA-binding YbaB/EbfC family protein
MKFDEPITEDDHMSRVGLSDMLKQAQKLQEQFQQAQEGLINLRAEGSAGGGMVTAIANGKQEILQLRIDKQAVDPNDLEMLEDLVVAAVNQALSKAQELASAEMSKAAGSVLSGLPGNLKIPGTEP